MACHHCTPGPISSWAIQQPIAAQDGTSRSNDYRGSSTRRLISLAGTPRFFRLVFLLFSVCFPEVGQFHDFSVGLLSLATIVTPPPFLPYHPVRRWTVTIMTGSNILGDSPSPQTSLLQSAILMLKGSWPSQPKQKTIPWLRLHSTVWMMPGQKHP